MENSSEKPIKVILLGETGTGKTSLINVSIGINFKEKLDLTFSNSYVIKKININNQIYNLEIWDTIGQERYKHLTKLFFKGSKIVILVYDKSKKESFNKIDFWFNEVKTVLNTDEIILAIVANKDDLEINDDDVDEDKAREYSKKINAKFQATSAKMKSSGFVQFLTELLVDYIKKCGGNVKIDDKIVLTKKKKKKHKCYKC